MKDKKPEKSKTEKQVKKAAGKLEQQLVELEKEKAELFEKLQRVSADYANFQKRSVRQVTDDIAYEKEKILKSLLPAIDNFEHMLASAGSAEDVEVFVKGVRIIYDQMLDILKSHNVEQIKAAGEKFDPSLHQAMMQRAEPEKEEGTVLEEFQKGYTLNGRVIRPSKVIVNKPQEQAEPGEDTEQ